MIILHACAQNPSGIDPSKEQWQEIARVLKEREIFPVLDAAYLGFNSGNVDEDAFAIRLIVNELGMDAAVCVSFAKNMGLYGTLLPFLHKKGSEGDWRASSGCFDRYRVANTCLLVLV